MTVLLVDDEQLELDILEHSINWNLFGIDRVLTAANGKRAFHIIENEMPEIVITDIQMPVMDGLALARRILAEELPIKIIFLTGYDNFSYIKVAFRLDVVDYILKPVIPLQINDVMRRTVELVKKEKRVKQSLELSKRVIVEKIMLGDDWENLAMRLVDVTETYHLLQVHARWHQSFYKEICQEHTQIRYGVYQKNRCTFLVASGEKLDRLVKKIMSCAKQEDEVGAGAVYSHLSFTISHIREGYQMCASYADWIYCGEMWSCLEVVEPCRDSFTRYDLGIKSKLVNQLKLFLPKGDLNKIAEAVENVFDSIKPTLLRKEEAIRFQTDILTELDHYFAEGNEAIQVFLALKAEDAVKKMKDTIHVQEGKWIFKKYILQIYSYFQVQEQGKYAYIVLRVKEYVERHYQGSISMEDLSGELFLSVNYIRSIFKEQTGQTILEYITDYRFSAAEILLKHKELKIGEISKQIGYDNVSYFCAVFTKRYGMSPGDYRNTF